MPNRHLAGLCVVGSASAFSPRNEAAISFVRSLGRLVQFETSL